MMTFLFSVLFLVLYLLPFSLIQLNSIMSLINAKRKNQSIEYDKLLLNGFFGSLPIVNLMISIMIPLIAEEPLLLTYHKGLNDPMQCRKCGIVTRRHYLKDAEPHQNYYDRYVYSEYTVCPFCEAKHSLSEAPKYRSRVLPFGKRISFFKGMVLFFTGGKSRKERQLKKLLKQQEELSFADDQLASYNQLQEQKLQMYLRKAEEVKRSLSSTDKKEVDHAKLKTTVD